MKNNETKPKRTLVIVMRWALVVLWAAVIFFMSSNSGSNLNDDLGIFSQIYQSLNEFQESILGPDVDILSPLAHFTEYAILSFLLVNALWQHMPLKKACLVAIACASIYGITDEFHQYFIPERMSDPVDWVVDTLGAALGSAVAYPLIQRIDSMKDSIKQ